MRNNPPFSVLLRNCISTWLDVLLGGSLGSPSVKTPSFRVVSCGPSLRRRNITGRPSNTWNNSTQKSALKMFKSSNKRSQSTPHDRLLLLSFHLCHKACLFFKRKHIPLACFSLIGQNKVNITDTTGTTGLDCVAPVNRHPKGVALEAVALPWQSPGVGMAN